MTTSKYQDAGAHVTIETNIAELCLDEYNEKEEHASSGSGGYKFDPEIVKQQRQAIWNWLKTVGANIFRDGVNLTKISMPVQLFEKRSFLERLASNWDYLDLLMAAANAADPVDRMKYVVGFAVSGLCRQMGADKPFNPILGETYQARYANGVEVYAEQISHHPPISSWEVVDPNGKFVFHGNGNWSASARGNSIKGRQSGVNRITFSDGSDISYELPGLHLKGILWGDRVIKYHGEMIFTDRKNDLMCEVQVDPQASTGIFGGWFGSSKSSHKPDSVKGTLKKGDKVLDTCTGTWLSHLDWEKGIAAGSKVARHRIWDIKASPIRHPVAVEAEMLPSDCRHREDLAHLRRGDMAEAQRWKQVLEDVQRRDRKLRQEGGGYGH